MKAGDLVVVKGTSTGDNPWVVDLYRTQKPVLVLEIDGWVKIVDDGKKKYLSRRKVKVVS